MGGNGFVGAHLVARLSCEPGVRKVWATVRAAPGATPEQRLEQTLAEYRFTAIDRSKVELLDAILTKTWLGLSNRR